MPNYHKDELAQFFDQSFDLLCIAGVDGYFKRLNPSWATELGWSLEELMARPFAEFVHPEDLPATLAEVEKLADGSTTILFENRYRHRDGSYRWLQWNARSIPGNPKIYAAARDVTLQRTLEREILEIADHEKERLGHELHDGLCQNLAGIAALSTTLARRMRSAPESAALTTAVASAEEIARLLQDAMQLAQDMARGLSHFGLERDGLSSTLRDLAANVGHMFRTSCVFEGVEGFPRLCPDVEAHLFRIAQEAVRNSVAHGQASQIAIQLKTAGSIGELVIRDDGIGYPEPIGDEAGSGMRTMAYRSRLIGGQLHIRPGARRGAEIVCEFPLRLSSELDEGSPHAL